MDQITILVYGRDGTFVVCNALRGMMMPTGAVKVLIRQTYWTQQLKSSWDRRGESYGSTVGGRNFHVLYLINVRQDLSTLTQRGGATEV